MKTCKVKPDKDTCRVCLATQQMFGVVDNCSECELNKMRYEWVGTTYSTLWGSIYALVQSNGVIYKVLLDLVYDIKED